MFDKDIKRILQKISTRCILKKEEMPKFNLVISTCWLKTAKSFEDYGGFIFTQYLSFLGKKAEL